MIQPPALIQPASAPSPAAAIGAVLDDFHRAAAQADEARYFGHLDDTAVFLGTDATERWTKAQFQAYAHPYFAKGRAWTFRPVRRAITLAADGRTAWFDEDLDTPNLGPCRGSGVLVLTGGGWKIAQYNLAFTVPNGAAKAVEGTIAAFLAGRK